MTSGEEICKQRQSGRVSSMKMSYMAPAKTSNIGSYQRVAAKVYLASEI